MDEELNAAYEVVRTVMVAVSQDATAYDEEVLNKRTFRKAEIYIYAGSKGAAFWNFVMGTIMANGYVDARNISIEEKDLFIDDEFLETASSQVVQTAFVDVQNKRIKFIKTELEKLGIPCNIFNSSAEANRFLFDLRLINCLSDYQRNLNSSEAFDLLEAFTCPNSAKLIEKFKQLVTESGTKYIDSMKNIKLSLIAFYETTGQFYFPSLRPIIEEIKALN
jgi:hypothetical protein